MAAPVSLAITPNTGVSTGLTNSKAISLTGTLPATGLKVHIADTTSGVDYGISNAFAGTGFSIPLLFSTTGIHQLSVNTVDSLGNLSPASTFSLFIDTTSPTVTNLSNPASPSNTALASVNVTFSESIIAAGFDWHDVVLTLNGGANLITSAVGVTLVSGNTYRVDGLDGVASGEGNYVLTILPAGVTDLAGNPGIGSPSMTWVLDRTSPVSRIVPLATIQDATLFNISALGSDPVPAAGIAAGVASYDLYVRDYSDPDPAHAHYTRFATVPASDPIASFAGQSNHAYGFYSIAFDAAGNAEPSKGNDTAEASTYVPDLDPPVTRVLPPLAADIASPTFLLNVQGTDSGASGLRQFDVYVAVDGGAAQKFAEIAAGLPAMGLYSGQATYQAIADGNSHTYAFFSVGIDGNHNVEPAPAMPDATVTQTFAPPAALQVTSFVIQDGLAERSFIRTIDVTFNLGGQALDDLVNTPGRITLVHNDLNGVGGQALSLAGIARHLQGAADHVIELDFGPNGLGGVSRGTTSLAQYWANMIAGDGYYQLSFDLDNDASHAVDTTLGFYRLLGDVNGMNDPQHVVDATDLAIIGLAGDDNADVNGDGIVNGDDTNLMRRSNGRRLAVNLRLDG